jgi:hypothetical protein
MSIGPLSSVLGGAAGAPLAQSAGSDIERTQHDAAAQGRQRAAAARADSAEGITQADGQDLETNDRDADGRRAWEIGPNNRRTSARDSAPAATQQIAEPAPGSLDLTG